MYSVFVIFDFVVAAFILPVYSFTKEKRKLLIASF
jgi:hypothetical protein